MAWWPDFFFTHSTQTFFQSKSKEQNPEIQNSCALSLRGQRNQCPCRFARWCQCLSVSLAFSPALESDSPNQLSMWGWSCWTPGKAGMVQYPCLITAQLSKEFYMLSHTKAKMVHVRLSRNTCLLGIGWFDHVAWLQQWFTRHFGHHLVHLFHQVVL